jgi:hypothetical protein
MAIMGLVSYQLSLSVGLDKVIPFILLMAGLFVYTLWKNQEKMLYQPNIYPQYSLPKENPPMYQSPKEHGMPHEEVYLNTRDGQRLHAWFIRQPNSKSVPTILYFHENAANMGFRLPNLKVMYDRLKVNIFILSYRGYGESTGTPGEHGLIEDAEAAFCNLISRSDIDKKQIIVFGRSLGGAVAIALANKYCSEINGMIIENSYTCISDMVDKIFPLLSPLKSLILRLDWPSWRRIATITTPILFVSGLLDEVVPCEQMQKLFKLAVNSRSKQIVTIPDGMHNDTWLKGGELYLRNLRNFILSSTNHELPSQSAQDQNEIDDKQALDNVQLIMQQSAYAMQAAQNGLSAQQAAAQFNQELANQRANSTSNSTSSSTSSSISSSSSDSRGGSKSGVSSSNNGSGTNKRGADDVDELLAELEAEEKQSKSRKD